jgi:predicted PurR-regulated permease PerM
MDNASAQWKGWIQLALGLTLSVLFFYMMAPFMVALLLGAVTAIICYPPYADLRKYLPAKLSALLVTVGMALGILLPFIFILYSGSYRLLNLISQIKLPRPGQPLDTLLAHPTVNRLLGALSRFVPVDQEWIRSQALSVLEQVIEKLSKLVAGFLSGMPGLMLAFFVVILSAYFFLVDGAKFLRFLSSLSPLRAERSVELYAAFESSCRGVVLALFASALVQGALMAFLFLVTGLPDPMFIAVITILMGMVPVVGSAPIWIGATLYLFLNGAPVRGVVMLLGGVAVSTSDNVVRPWILKGHSEMHPLLALVSVFGAVSLFGATGIFLGPVIAAVFVSFLKILALEIRRENLPPTPGST